MELDYLLARHRTSLTRADAAVTGEARIAHRGLATIYAERIQALRIELQVAASG